MLARSHLPGLVGIRNPFTLGAMTVYPDAPRISFDTVKAHVSLREIIDFLELARKGRSFRCPNNRTHKHGDRNRSAYIAESGDSWRCYGCQAFGSVIDVYRYVYDVTKEDARDALAEYAGLIPAYGAAIRPALLKPPQGAQRTSLNPEAPLPAVASDVQAFLQQAQASLLTSHPATAYLERRRIPLSVARAAGLGYAPRGTWPHARGAGQPRVIAPLTTPDGTLINLYGRSTVPCEKRLRHDFLPGPKGFFHARALAEDGVILVEGVFDALSCLAGFRPSAAIMGLSFRDGWWLEMPAQVILLAPDADEAGQRRREDLQRLGAQAGKTVFTLRPDCLGGHKDLNEFWVKSHLLPNALDKFFRVYLPREIARLNGARTPEIPTPRASVPAAPAAAPQAA